MDQTDKATSPPARKLLLGLIGERDLATELGYRSRQSIHNLLRQGLPSIKLGGKRLFDIEKVRAWVLSHEVDMSPRKPGRPKGDSR
jgi:hypothetical protein